MIDRFGAMATFAKVVETGSFSAAAAALGVSKSAISKQVSRLEDELGVRLLNRTTRRLSLTEAGATFLGGCKRMVEAAEAAEAAVTHLSEAPRGDLKVNAPMSFGFLHLAPLIPEFIDRAPEITIDMTMNDRRVDLIDEGYDLAIRIGQLEDSRLIARKLAPARFVICASPDYLARRGEPRTFEDLARHSCLLYTYPQARDEWRLGSGTQSIRVPVKGPLRANNGDALRAAAVRGLGLARLPTFIAAEDIARGRLRPVLCDHPAEDGGIFVVYPHTRHLSAKVRAFVDFLVESFSPEPYWDREIAHVLRETAGE